MLKRFVQIQSMDPHSFYQEVSTRRPIESNNYPNFPVPEECGSRVSKKRKPNRKAPPTPDPRRAYLANRNQDMLRFHQIFGQKFQISDFEVVLLTRGSFGEVYKSSHTSDGSVSIIKKSILPLIGEFELKQTRSRLEIFSLFTKKQAHVLHHHAAWVENAHVFVKTEWCLGGDLEAAIQRNVHENEGQIWRLLLETAQGLNCIHSMQLLHRDIKPANIFMEENNRYVIGDFGHMTYLARPSSCDLDSRYMAKEALDSIQTAAMDIFSLGLVVLECMTDDALPRSGPRWEKLRSGRDLFQHLRFAVSPELRGVVTRMLDEKWTARPTAGELSTLVIEIDRKMPYKFEKSMSHNQTPIEVESNSTTHESGKDMSGIVASNTSENDFEKVEAKLE